MIYFQAHLASQTAKWRDLPAWAPKWPRASQISIGHRGTRLPDLAHASESGDFGDSREAHLQTTPADESIKLNTGGSNLCSQIKTHASELD